MSPCELWAEFEIAREKRLDRFERDVTLAWMVNNIHLQITNKKRLDPVAAFLPKSRGASRKMTTPTLDQQLEGFMAISRQYKIPVREVMV